MTQRSLSVSLSTFIKAIGGEMHPRHVVRQERMLARFEPYRGGPERPDKGSAIQSIQIDVRLSREGRGTEEKGKAKSKSGTFSYLCVASRSASLSNPLSGLSEAEGDAPLFIPIWRSWREAYEAFVDWKLDKMARAA